MIWICNDRPRILPNIAVYHIHPKHLKCRVRSHNFITISVSNHTNLIFCITHRWWSTECQLQFRQTIMKIIFLILICAANPNDFSFQEAITKFGYNEIALVILTGISSACVFVCVRARARWPRKLNLQTHKPRQNPNLKRVLLLKPSRMFRNSITHSNQTIGHTILWWFKIGKYPLLSTRVHKYGHKFQFGKELWEVGETVSYINLEKKIQKTKI